MAVATGGDVIIRLMQDVTELKEVASRITTHLQELREVTTRHLQELVGLSKRQGEALERVGKSLAGLAERLDDHERRISALEARS